MSYSLKCKRCLYLLLCSLSASLPGLLSTYRGKVLWDMHLAYASYTYSLGLHFKKSFIFKKRVYHCAF